MSEDEEEEPEGIAKLAALPKLVDTVSFAMVATLLIALVSLMFKEAAVWVCKAEASEPSVSFLRLAAVTVKPEEATPAKA